MDIRASGFFALLAFNQIAQMAGSDSVIEQTHALLNGITKELQA